MAGDLPDEWIAVQVDQLGEVVTGSTPSTSNPSNFGGSIPFVTPASLSGERWVREGVCTLSERGVLAARLVPEGAVLVSCIGILGKVGQAAQDCVPNQQINAIVPNSSVDGGYLYHAAQTLRNQMERIAGIQVIPIVNKSGFRRLRLLAPPIPEQRRIAAILDTLDEAIRRTQQVIEKLKQMKQGLLHDLLTRGIDDNGELRPPPDEAPHLYQDSPLGRIPRGWDVLDLERLSVQIVDGVHHTPTYREYGVPFLTVENLTRTPGISLTPCRFVSHRDHIDFSRRAEPQAGDVLVTKDGTLGVARLVPSSLGEVSIFVSVALLKIRGDLIRSELVCTFFDTASFRSQLAWLSAGSGLKHIHLEHFRRFQLVVPPLAEQSVLLSKIAQQEDRLRLEVAEIAKLRTLKHGLMDDLLTGRVRVPIAAVPDLVETSRP